MTSPRLPLQSARSGGSGTITRVVVIEDSPTQRAFLRRSLEAEGDISVVGEATTAMGAVAAVNRAAPDVVTVDLDIPGGGEVAIERILQSGPQAIVVLTGRPMARATALLGDLGIPQGAVIVKPLRWDEASEHALRRKVRGLSSVRSRTRGDRPGDDFGAAESRATSARNLFGSDPPSSLSSKPVFVAPTPFGVPGDRPDSPLPAGKGIIALAASTGGPSALVTVLKGLAGLDAPVLVVQHIGAQTFVGLAEWLAKSSGWPVDVASDGDPLMAGRVLIGPPGTHLTVAEGPRVALPTTPVRTHMPSADELFSSLARVAPKTTVAAILTGMGADGAAGMLSLRLAGGVTIGQDEESSAVYGMAKAASDLDALRHVVALDKVAPTIMRVARGIL